MTKIPETEHNIIIHRYEEGEKAIDLAADYDVSTERIYQILRKHDIPLHRPHGPKPGNGRKIYEPRSYISLERLAERLAS